jgi:hypothetical protein
MGLKWRGDGAEVGGMGLKWWGDGAEVEGGWG